MIRTTAAFFLAAAAAESLGAQTPRVSAPVAGISYEITADSAAVGRRQLGVAMSFRVASNAPVILSLPAWSPGHYTLLWFARRVSNFSAQSGDGLLAWRKLDFETWEIRPRGAGKGRVSFRYLADAVDRAV